jgi:ammonia channel protein AmtB
MFQSLAYRMIGAAAIITWGGFACCVMFGTLKLLGQLRVTEEEERKGKLFQKLTSCAHPSGSVSKLLINSRYT